MYDGPMDEKPNEPEITWRDVVKIQGRLRRIEQKIEALLKLARESREGGQEDE